MKNNENNNDERIKKINIVYLIILMILLIFTFVISFKTGESMYYLINTNPEGEDTNSYSEIAGWQLEVRIEY